MSKWVVSYGGFPFKLSLVIVGLIVVIFTIC